MSQLVRCAAQQVRDEPRWVEQAVGCKVVPGVTSEDVHTRLPNSAHTRVTDMSAGLWVRRGRCIWPGPAAVALLLYRPCVSKHVGGLLLVHTHVCVPYTHRTSTALHGMQYVLGSVMQAISFAWSPCWCAQCSSLHLRMLS
jgi:hypothetical protein